MLGDKYSCLVSRAWRGSHFQRPRGRCGRKPCGRAAALPEGTCVCPGRDVGVCEDLPGLVWPLEPGGGARWEGSETPDGGGESGPRRMSYGQGRCKDRAWQGHSEPPERSDRAQAATVHRTGLAAGPQGRRPEDCTSGHILHGLGRRTSRDVTKTRMEGSGRKKETAQGSQPVTLW